MTSECQDELLQLKIPSDFKHLHVVRDFVGGIAEECGFSDSEIYQIISAVDEAVANIIEHACKLGSEEEIKCFCGGDEESLTVILEDMGKPFDPDSIEKTDLFSDLDDRDTGGLGLLFIHSYMDEVHYSPSRKGGKEKIPNRLVLKKRKGSEHRET